MAAELITIFWRDIPAQVTAKSDSDRASIELQRRFSMAIDRAAMTAGLAGSDEYLQHWIRKSRPCGDDLAAEVQAESSALEAAYPQPRLEALVATGGVEPAGEE